MSKKLSLNFFDSVSLLSQIHRMKSTHPLWSVYDNATIEKTDAEKQQIQVNILLGLAQLLGDDTIIEKICDVLDLDYDEIKDNLPKDDIQEVQQVQDTLNNIVPDDVVDEGGESGEQKTG